MGQSPTLVFFGFVLLKVAKTCGASLPDIIMDENAPGTLLAISAPRALATLVAPGKLLGVIVARLLKSPVQRFSKDTLCLKNLIF